MKKKVLGIVLATVLALSLGLVMAGPVGASPGPGIAGLWHLDDGIGTTASDSSGNGNNGVLRMGIALDFDGDDDGDDYVVVADHDTLSVSGAVTLEALIKPSSLPDPGIVMVAGKWNDDVREYEIQIHDRKVRFYAYDSSDSTLYFAESATALVADGSWYHVAGVWDGTILQVYIDGAADGSSTSFDGPIPNTAARFTIGAQYWGSTWWRPFDGLIDEVCISDVARTSFEACVPSVDSDTVALWHFDEGTGTTAADESTNGSYGQLGSDPNDPAWDDSGPTWATGICGDALSFDGDDCVCLPASNSILNTSTFTVEAWFKTSVNHPVYGAGIKEGRLVNLHRMATASTAVSLYVEQDMIGLLYYNGSNHIFLKHTVDYHDDVWHHIAVTYDSSTYRLYYDGTQVASQTDTFGGFGSFPAYLGTYNGSERFFNGLIDEVRIWDSATPIFDVDADPNTAVNPVGTTHDIEVEVTVGGTGEPALCMPVNLEVIGGGPNDGETQSDVTDCDGKVTFTLNGDGGAGTDTIRIWVDQDCDGSFTDADASYEVTKHWVTFDADDGLTPPVAYNPVGGRHCVTALVDPAVAGAEVFFEVSGANTASGSVTTGTGGTAEFCYDGDNPGTDNILAYLDVNDNQSFDDGTDISLTVTKYWLEHFVTGGGNITEGKGKTAAKITFGGNVGFDLAGNEVGQWNINFHNVDGTAYDKGHFHSTVITHLSFVDYSDPPENLPDPSPPVADYNYVRFDATGKFNGDDGWKLRVNATDFGEGKKIDPDEIRIRLWAPGVSTSSTPTYDSYGSGDFPDESYHVRTDLDGGNIQIHPPEIPTP